MNPPTLDKITLTAAALLVSFALTAHPDPANFSSAGQAYGLSKSVVTRNGSVIATSDNDGNGRDSIGGLTGVFIYQVCKTDGSGCSNQIRLRIFPHSD